MTVYSHTQLKTFEQCPLKYRFKHLDGIETVVESIETFLGKRVHEALKCLYEKHDEDPERLEDEDECDYCWKNG